LHQPEQMFQMGPCGKAVGPFHHSQQTRWLHQMAGSEIKQRRKSLGIQSTWYCHVLRVGNVTNNMTRVRIWYQIYSLWRLQLQHWLQLRWTLAELHCADVSLRRLDWLLTHSDSGDWLMKTNSKGRRTRTNFVYCLPPYNTVPATMETLAFLLLVAMQRNNTGVVSISMELFDYGYLVVTRVLHSNNGLWSNTSHCSLLKAIFPEWPNKV
jgi:hypothetical protein